MATNRLVFGARSPLKSTGMQRLARHDVRQSNPIVAFDIVSPPHDILIHQYYVINTPYASFTIITTLRCCRPNLQVYQPYS